MVLPFLMGWKAGKKNPLMKSIDAKLDKLNKRNNFIRAHPEMFPKDNKEMYKKNMNKVNKQFGV